MMHGELYSVEKLGRLLEDGDPNAILMLDCRMPNDYNSSHIKGALPVVIPSIMLRRLKKGNISVAQVINSPEGKERFTNKCQNQLVILYDENTRDTSNPSNVVNLLLKKLREDGCMTYILSGGYECFYEEFPHLCGGLQQNSGEDQTILGFSNLNITDVSTSKIILNGEKKECPTLTNNNVFPVEVLPYLFLGNAQNSADSDCLCKHQISYVLNVTPNVENKFKGSGTIKYLQIPITDHWSQNISNFFPKAISFIDEARENECGVLVHCLAGISRSVTVTVAYLMHAMNLSLNEAYDFVRTKKPNISPNFNFMGQLLDFEKSLKIRDCQCLCPKDTSAIGGLMITAASSSSSASSTSSLSTSSPPSSSELDGTLKSPGSACEKDTTSLINTSTITTPIIISSACFNNTSSINATTTSVSRSVDSAICNPAAISDGSSSTTTTASTNNKTLLQITSAVSATSPTTTGPSSNTPCPCSCHDLKSFFSTPSSTTSCSSSGGSFGGAEKFSYNDIPPHTPS